MTNDTSTHTPGPWHLEEADGTIRASRQTAFSISDQMGDYRGVIVCDLAPALGAWPTLGRKHAEPETRANARLIAAAPELLALCQRALNESARVHPDFMRDLQSVIAKATGGVE